MTSTGAPLTTKCRWIPFSWMESGPSVRCVFAGTGISDCRSVLALVVVVACDTDAVTVRDYGVGLRLGEEKLVFSRFWRSDPSRVRRSGGTGLGLAISVEDARLHQGRLEAWGEPGNGVSDNVDSSGFFNDPGLWNRRPKGS